MTARDTFFEQDTPEITPTEVEDPELVYSDYAIPEYYGTDQPIAEQEVNLAGTEATEKLLVADDGHGQPAAQDVELAGEVNDKTRPEQAGNPIETAAQIGFAATRYDFTAKDIQIPDARADKPGGSGREPQSVGEGGSNIESQESAGEADDTVRHSGDGGDAGLPPDVIREDDGDRRRELVRKYEEQFRETVDRLRTELQHILPRQHPDFIAQNSEFGPPVFRIGAEDDPDNKRFVVAIQPPEVQQSLQSLGSQGDILGMIKLEALVAGLDVDPQTADIEKIAAYDEGTLTLVREYAGKPLATWDETDWNTVASTRTLERLWHTVQGMRQHEPVPLKPNTLGKGNFALDEQELTLLSYFPAREMVERDEENLSEFHAANVSFTNIVAELAAACPFREPQDQLLDNLEQLPSRNLAAVYEKVYNPPDLTPERVVFLQTKLFLPEQLGELHIRGIYESAEYDEFPYADPLVITASKTREMALAKQDDARRLSALRTAEVLFLEAQGNPDATYRDRKFAQLQSAFDAPFRDRATRADHGVSRESRSKVYTEIRKLINQTLPLDPEHELSKNELAQLVYFGLMSKSEYFAFPSSIRQSTGRQGSRPYNHDANIVLRDGAEPQNVPIVIEQTRVPGSRPATAEDIMLVHVPSRLAAVLVRHEFRELFNDEIFRKLTIGKPEVRDAYATHFVAQIIARDSKGTLNAVERNLLKQCTDDFAYLVDAYLAGR